jgi:hypothetical protein
MMLTMRAGDVRPGDRVRDPERGDFIVGQARTFGTRARCTTIDPVPFRGDPRHYPTGALVTVERACGETDPEGCCDEDCGVCWIEEGQEPVK